MKQSIHSNTSETDELKLDSSYLIAFEMAHIALKRGIAAVSSLNSMQYHALIKIFATGEQGISQTDLGLMLDMKPNMVSQMINVLEAAGYVVRIKNDNGDGRVRTLKVTSIGEEHAATVNVQIVEQLYTTFPTQNDMFRSILEASIAAGASIDPPISEQTISRFPASRALLSIELIRRTIEAILKRLADVSFGEYRILQRLRELDGPLRSIDLSRELRIAPTAIVRATDRLVERGWVTRLASPVDRKAVFIAATTLGARKQKSISETIDSLARNYLWKNLNAEQRHAIAQVGHIVIAHLQENEEAERKAALRLLKPIS